jgi:hypothetical protein
VRFASNTSIIFIRFIIGTSVLRFPAQDNSGSTAGGSAERQTVLNRVIYKVGTTPHGARKSYRREF